MLYITHAKFNYLITGNFHLFMKGQKSHKLIDTENRTDWCLPKVGVQNGRNGWKWSKGKKHTSDIEVFIDIIWETWPGIAKYIITNNASFLA